MMPEPVFVDTNIVLNFILGNHPEHSPETHALFEAASKGAVTLWFTETVLFESEYILAKQHSYTRSMIRSVFDAMLEIPNVTYAGHAAIDEVFDLYLRFSKLSWADCFHAVVARSSAARAIVSYDKAIGNVPGLTRLEPLDVIARR